MQVSYSDRCRPDCRRVVAAPIGARLAGKLNTKTVLIAVGVLVIISSGRTLLKAAGVF